MDSPSSSPYRAAAELRAALRAYERKAEIAARANGLTPRRYDLLLMVAATENATVTKLMDRLQLGQAAVSELVQRGIDRGLLERRPSPVDRRETLLQVSELGKQKLDATLASLHGEQLLPIIPPDHAGPSLSR